MTTENQYESIESKIVARALKDDAFKQALLDNSAVAKTEIEKELGEALPEGFSINVVQETPNTAYIVLPYVPSTEGMTEEELEAVAGGRGAGGIARTAVKTATHIHLPHHHDHNKR